MGQERAIAGYSQTVENQEHNLDRCNTGYSNTHNDLEASIDYLTVTFSPSESAVETAMDFFGGGISVWRSRGLAGRYYSQSYRYEDLTLYYGGNGGGATVEARGKGCRQIERLRGISDEKGWREFFRELDNVGASFARVDFAFDDRSGNLSLEEIENNVRAGHCATRFRIASPTDMVKPKDGSIVGKVVSFGGRASKVCVRIYDKGLEQATGGEAVRPWVRVEVETKDHKADEFAERFVAEGFRSILSDLRARITFREATADSNKSRWPVCAWWAGFLSDAPRDLIVSQATSSTLEDKVRQIERQWGPILVAISAAPDYGNKWFDSAVTRNQSRLRESHIDLLAVACQEHQTKRENAIQTSVGW